MLKKILISSLLAMVAVSLNADERFIINSPREPRLEQQGGTLDPSQFAHMFSEQKGDLRTHSLTGAEYESGYLPVPSMDWLGGCVPTAVGMALFYWDAYRGFDDLLPNNGTNPVDPQNMACFASPEYFADYFNPQDTYTTGVKPDKSEDGNYHREDNCVSDWMGTSRSVESLIAGASWDDIHVEVLPDLVPKLNPDYRVEVKRQKITTAGTNLTNYITLNTEKVWHLIKSEIAAGRPLVAAANSGRGYSDCDHEVTIVGFVEQGDTRIVIMNNTWSTYPVYVYYGNNLGPNTQYSDPHPDGVDQWGIGQVDTIRFYKKGEEPKLEFTDGVLYKFRNKVNGAYFFTNNQSEFDWCKDNADFDYAGPVLFTGDGTPGEVPIYRFYNMVAGAHFYTASEAERDSILQNLSDVYRFEGVAFTGMPASAVSVYTPWHAYGMTWDADGIDWQPDWFALYNDGYMPVYRCYLPKTSSHYFTTNVDEYRIIATLDPELVVPEGIAWFAKPPTPHIIDYGNGEWLVLE